MAEIDWLKSSEKERRILYAHLKAEMDLRNIDLPAMLVQALGKTNLGQNYDTSMRTGRFARKYALSFYQWLEQKNPERAMRAISEIQVGTSSTKSAWAELIARPSKQIEIVPIKVKSLNVVGFASGIPVYEIERGRPFFLRIESEQSGFAIGFQKFRSVWYPLPLGRDQHYIAINAGTNELPRSGGGSEIDPICEETETGTFEFVLLLAPERLIVPPIESGLAISPSTLDKIADKCSENDQVQLHSTKLLIS